MIKTLKISAPILTSSQKFTSQVLNSLPILKSLEKFKTGMTAFCLFFNCYNHCAFNSKEVNSNTINSSLNLNTYKGIKKLF